jgi:hypothetical protein
VALEAVPPLKASCRIAARRLSMRLLGLSLSLIALVVTAAAAQNIVPNAATIATSKGDFAVPGRAFLDGSQPEARPPVTAMLVPLLQSAVSIATVCQVEHGTQVDLLEVQRDVEKKRYYFRVRALTCDGWVPESALATRKVPPIGNASRK